MYPPSAPAGKVSQNVVVNAAYANPTAQIGATTGSQRNSDSGPVDPAANC